MRAASYLTVVLLLTGQSVGAATPVGEEELLGTFTDWQTMRYDDGGRTCVMWSAPVPAGKRQAHAFITHRVGLKSLHEVSVRFGVALKAGGTVSALVGKQRFTLYVDGDTAWNPSAAEDLRMVKAMRAGATLQVTATAADGASLRDRYSLSGFTAANKKISAACAVKF